MKTMRTMLICLLALLAGTLPFGLNGQGLADLPWSHDRVLVVFSKGTDWETARTVLEGESGRLVVDDRAQIKGAELYLAWLDPAWSWDRAAILALRDRLQMNPAVQHVFPFVQPQQGHPLSLTGEVRVRLAPGTGTGMLTDWQSSGSIRSYKQDRYLSRWYNLELPKGIDPLAWIDDLGLPAGVEQVEPDYLYQVTVTSNDTYFDRQWGLDNQGYAIQGNGTPGADMSVLDAWTITTGSPDIRMAIIDSGVDTTHVDLKDNLVPGFDATGNGSQGFPNTNYPNDGHGTCCAGIAGAKGDNNEGVAGVCYDCSIVPIKLFVYIFNPFGDPLPFATGGDMADAISWAWQDGEADLISNSWGLTDVILPGLPGGTGVVEDALDLALDSARAGLGIPMFFSSGNEGDPPIWPGRREGLFSVNATSMCDEHKNPASCDGENWSGNFGLGLDVSAPGVLIASTDMMGSNGYSGTNYEFSFNGTSAACPNAAGVMGLVLSVAPNLSLEQAHAVLEGTCDKVGGYAYDTTLVNGTWTPELGYGRLNAFQAVQTAVLVASPEPGPDPAASWQVYPNPASHEIGIALELERPSQVRASLHDLCGRELHVLVNDKMSPGSYRQLFPIDGLGLPTGIYLVKLQMNGVNSCAKVLIER